MIQKKQQCLSSGRLWKKHTNETLQRLKTEIPLTTEILYMAHCEKTFEGFHCVFKSILKYFWGVSQLEERLAKNYRGELDIQESALSKTAIQGFMSHFFLNHLHHLHNKNGFPLLWLRERRKENKRGDQVEAPTAEAQCDNPRCQWVTLPSIGNVDTSL